MRKIILTGSEGFIGKAVAGYYESQKNIDLIKLDIQLGHDLGDEEFVKSFFREHRANYLINLFALNDHVDGGKTACNSLFDVSLESLDRYMKINISALFSVCREFARHNKGAIVNFSSIYGLVSPRNDIYGSTEKHIGYSITKGAVKQLTRHLAIHLAPDIRVNCVAPGGMENAQDEAFRKAYSKHSPMKRMMAREEVIGIIDFLCSENSTYLTGAILPVDGGWTTW